MTGLSNAVDAKQTGIQSLNSSGIFNGRTLTGTANQINITNGDGTTGNPTVALTSNIYVSGISFDSGTNTLSKYTVGTWTPTLTNTGSPPTPTYSVQVGRYTAIGNRVVLFGNVQTSAYTAGTGNMQMSSLPFTSQGTTNNNNIGAVRLITVTFGASVLYYVCNLSPASTSLDFEGIISGSTSLFLAASAGSAASTSQYSTTMVYQI